MLNLRQFFKCKGHPISDLESKFDEHPVTISHGCHGTRKTGHLGGQFAIYGESTDNLSETTKNREFASNTGKNSSFRSRGKTLDILPNL